MSARRAELWELGKLLLVHYFWCASLSEFRATDFVGEEGLLVILSFLCVVRQDL